jgi:negative regulator of sigma E activity
MTESQVLLLLQIPLAGVVVLVVVLFLKHLRETVDKFMASQSEMLDKFMLAIKEQREINVRSMKEVSDNIRELDRLVVDKLNEMEVSRAFYSTQLKKEQQDGK